jgi:hypothetical protein
MAKLLNLHDVAQEHKERETEVNAWRELSVLVAKNRKSRAVKSSLQSEKKEFHSMREECEGSRYFLRSIRSRKSVRNTVRIGFKSIQNNLLSIWSRRRQVPSPSMARPSALGSNRHKNPASLTLSDYSQRILQAATGHVASSTSGESSHLNQIESLFHGAGG